MSCPWQGVHLHGNNIGKGFSLKKKKGHKRWVVTHQDGLPSGILLFQRPAFRMTGRKHGAGEWTEDTCQGQ